MKKHRAASTTASLVQRRSLNASARDQRAASAYGGGFATGQTSPYPLDAAVQESATILD